VQEYLELKFENQENISCQGQIGQKSRKGGGNIDNKIGRFPPKKKAEEEKNNPCEGEKEVEKGMIQKN